MARCVGVDVGFLSRMRCKTSKEVHEADKKKHDVACRFYSALALQDLIDEVCSCSIACCIADTKN